MSETSADVVKRYLHDALAGEKSSEVLMETFTAESVTSPVRQIALDCVQTSRRHQEQLGNRLTSLGANISDSKSLFARIFERPVRSPETKDRAADQTIRNLIEILATSHSEIAMYETLATMAQAAGDNDTAALAKLLQSEKKAMAEQLSTTVRAVVSDSPAVP